MSAWWALRLTGHAAEALAVEAFLLSLWDDELGRFRSGSTSSHHGFGAFLDNSTWGAAMLRAIGRPLDARRALSYGSALLATPSTDGSRCGLADAGPVGIWNGGTLQFVAEGGPGSVSSAAEMVTQAPGGGLPGSPDDFTGGSSWLTPWLGVSPTAYLYLAATGGPLTRATPTHAQGLTWYTDGAIDRMGPGGTTVTAYGTQLRPHTAYHLVAGTHADPDQPCSRDAIPINPNVRVSNASGFIGLTSGRVHRPPGQWRRASSPSTPGRRPIGSPACR